MAEIQIEYIGIDTISNSVKKGVVSRIMQTSMTSEEFPLVVAYTIPVGQVGRISQLASLDSLFTWSAELGVDNLNTESLVDNGIYEPGLKRIDIHFEDGGYQVVSDARPYPLNVKYVRDVCTVSAIRE